MKITQLAVRNPVGTILIILVVAVLGIIGVLSLPTGYFPVFSIPAAVVVTAYPGASALEVEQEITKPIERTISTVTDIYQMRSTSSEGFSQVQLSLNWGADLDEAVYEIQTQLEQVRNELPREADKPTVVTINSLLQVSMELGITSTERDLAELREYVEDYLQDRFSRVEEVATVQVSGGTERIVEVLIDRGKLASRDISLMQVMGALQSNNITAPGGRITEDSKEYVVRTIGRYQTVDEIKRTRITDKDDIPIYLEDVAKVSFTKAEERVFTRINCKPSVGVGIGTRSDGNVVAMCDAVKEELKVLEKTLPEDIEIFIAQDQSKFIKRSVNSVVTDALIGGLLAAVVVFLFLGNIRNTLVIAISIPTSILATFMMMRAFNLSLNIVSLGGLALGIGLVVDSAIIVLESIYRHIGDNTKGDREESTVFGTREVGLAITASTLTTLSVFLPMVFLRGLAAVLLGELALTVVFALVASLLVAITVVPMLGNQLIKVEEGHASNLWNRVTGIYKTILDWCLNHRWITIGVAFVIFILSLGLTRLIDVELLPATDESQFQVTLEYPVGTSLDITEDTSCKLEKFLSQYPEVETVFTTIGQAGPFAEEVPYKAEMMVQLSSDRDESTQEFIEQLRKEIPSYPDAKVEVALTTLIRDIGGAAVDVRIQGSDLDILRDLGEKAVAAVSDIEGLVNLQSSLSEGNPEIQVKIDREMIADLGINISDITGTIRTAVAGSTADQWSSNGREYDIQVRLPEESRDSAFELSNLLIPTRNKNIPLNQVAKITYGEGPVTIEHNEQIRNVAITADTRDGSQRAIVAEVRDRLENLDLPEGYEVVYEGQSRAVRDSFRSLGIALAIAVFLVYVVMGVQFESFIYPFIIMFSLPLASVGAFLALFIARSSISLNSFLGLLVLAGIVVNDSIVLVDYINSLRSRGKERQEAILTAGPVRLRPILMTSFTTIFGLLPIALGLGEGAETLAPLGISVIGGLFTSTFLTLLVIPCVYTIIDDLSRRKFRSKEN
ncbi:MMPL family transporter [Candidatus Poribacteria bacterium]|nr:MMPL family transporter [Candidatus Poribacteria bacterium]